MTTATTRTHASVQPKSPSAEDAEWGTLTMPATRTAVLRISRMPKKLRPAVESAMVYSLPSEPGGHATTDPLTTDLCTQWQRDRAVTDCYALSCCQLLSGLETELRHFAQAMDILAEEHDFDGAVQLLD